MEPQTAPANPAPQQPQKSPEQVIIELRARVNSGGQLTREEVREALVALRQNRLSAAEAAGKKPAAKSSGPTRSAADLLASLKGATTTPTTGT